MDGDAASLERRDLECSRASFHREAHRHHLQPEVSPMDRRSLPRDAVKSRKGSVRVAVGMMISWWPK